MDIYNIYCFSPETTVKKTLTYALQLSNNVHKILQNLHDFRDLLDFYVG